MRIWTGVWSAALLASLVACQTDDSTSATGLIDNQREQPLTGSAGVSPIENYKQQVMADALRGLTFDSGLVEVDGSTGRAVNGIGDSTAARSRFDQAQSLRFERSLLIPAISAYVEAVIMTPDDPVLLEGLGRALWAKGRSSKAEAAYRTALLHDPDYADAHLNLATVLYGTGRYDQGITEWRRVLELEADNAEAHERMATAQYFAGRYGEAWGHVHAVERVGGNLPAQLRSLLAARLAEPAR